MLQAPYLIPARALGGWEPDKLFRGGENGFCVFNDPATMWQEAAQTNLVSGIGTNSIGAWDDVSGNGWLFDHNDSGDYGDTTKGAQLPLPNRYTVGTSTSGDGLCCDMTGSAVSLGSDFTILIAMDGVSTGWPVSSKTAASNRAWDSTGCIPGNAGGFYHDSVDQVTTTPPGSGVPWVFSVFHDDSAQDLYLYHDMAEVDSNLTKNMPASAQEHVCIGGGATSGGAGDEYALNAGGALVGCVGVLYIQRNLLDDPHDQEKMIKFFAWLQGRSV